MDKLQRIVNSDVDAAALKKKMKKLRGTANDHRN